RQRLWTILWKDPVHQAHAVSVLRAHEDRYIRRTDRDQATSPLQDLATVTSLTQENLTFVLWTVKKRRAGRTRQPVAAEARHDRRAPQPEGWCRQDDLGPACGRRLGRTR